MVKLTVLVLTLLVALQPVTTDFYLPALPILVSDLQTTVAAVQLTLSLLMISHGIGQLAWGPVSDRWGRRPVLLAGLVLYTLAAAAAACAPSITHLIAYRVMQGAALGAAIVCARAMVRDLYEPVQGTRIMTLSFSGAGLLSMTLPVLGGWLASQWGWRAPFAASAVYAFGAFVLIALSVPETRPPGTLPPISVRAILQSYRDIARNPTFLTWAILCSFAYASNFSFFATSSYVFIGRLGLSSTMFGAVLGAASISFLLGTMVCRRWVGLHGVQVTVRRGGWLILGATVLWVVPALLGEHTTWTLASGICIQLFVFGIFQPCGQVGQVAPFANRAGAASALGGCMLALGSFLATIAAGAVFDGTSRSLALSTAVLLLPCITISLFAVKRYGDARKPG